MKYQEVEWALIFLQKEDYEEGVLPFRGVFVPLDDDDLEHARSPPNKGS
jgi:hypothetical protein